MHRNDLGPLPRKSVSVCPGLLGGVETPMAYADGRVFVPVVNLCFPESSSAAAASRSSRPTTRRAPASSSRSTRPVAPASGAPFPSPNFGCATVAGNVVFTATYDGAVYGLSTRDGSTLLHARARAGINSCPAVAGHTLLVGAGTDHPAFPARCSS